MGQRDSIFEKVPNSPGGILGGFVRVGLVYPWIWLASVYGVWLVAFGQLGRRPRPLLDDPQILGGWVDMTHTASVVLMLFALPILAASLLAAVSRGVLRRAPWTNVLWWLAALQASWILAGMVARLDPGHVVAWFAD